MRLQNDSWKFDMYIRCSLRMLLQIQKALLSVLRTPSNCGMLLHMESMVLHKIGVVGPNH